jgi:hypothetical protein
MAITIQAQLAKRIPIPGIGFSSQQASITVTAEIVDLNQVVAEAKRLYSLAELAVDAQLNQAPATQAALPQSPTTAAPSASPAQRPAASQPYRSSPQRRQPTLCSPAQARYLRQLGDRKPAALADALAQHGVDSVEQLPARAASATIDQILQGAA